MDSGDIKNIEKAVQNVEKKVDDVKKDVVNKMDDIENVLNSTKKAANNIAGNTSSLKDIKDKVGKVVTKLEALKEIQKWTKEQSGSKNGKTNITGGIEDGVKNILKQQQSIFGEAEKISKHTESINTNTKDAADYLKLIKEHIVDGNASKQSVKPAAVTNTDAKDSITSISKNVAAIVTILEDIRNNTLSSGEGTEDSLKKLIRKNALTREKETRQKNEYRRIAGKDKKSWTEQEKKYLKAYEEREKNRKKQEEKASGRRGGSATAGKIISGVDSIIKEPKVANLANAGVSALSNVNPLVGAIAGLIKSVVELGSKQDRATTEFARTIGGGVYGKVNAGYNAMGMVRGGMPALRGYTADAAYSAMTEVAEARGRTTERMSKENLMSAIDLKRFGISADAINNFDTFGKSLEETDRYFAKLYGEVSKKGLSFKNVSKAVNDNLKQAQSHTFANGLRGLEQMAEKSVQLKYNMQQVFTLADKVSEIEGAISTAANLSVLGGQFAQFSNPMQLLYEGLNDMEALNDRMVKMFSGKAHWDADKGEMTMDALQREFVKQAAKAAGLDPNEMLNMSFNEAKMSRISSQIRPGLDKDTAEYIKNIAELDKKGNAYVTLNGETKEVSKLTNKDRDALEKESRAKEQRDSAKLGDIYQETSGIAEKMDNLLSYIKEKVGMWVFGIFQAVARRSGERQTIAQGEGSKELQEERLDFYREFSGLSRKERRKVFGTGKGGRKRNMAKRVAEYSEEDMDAFRKKKDDYESGAQMAGGSPIPSLVPGNYGFANGPTHWNGGIKASYENKPVEIEKNEFLLNRQSSMKYRDMLPKLQNGTFNPYSYANSIVKNDMNRHYMPMQVTPFEREMLKAAYKSANSNQPNTISGTIKVDIPQRITIDIAGGNKIGDYDISSVIAKYVDSFMKEMMMKNYTGFNKEDFHTKTVV